MSINVPVGLTTKSIPITATFGEWTDTVSSNKFTPVDANGKTNDKAKIGIYNTISTTSISGLSNNIFDEIYDATTATFEIKYTYSGNPNSNTYHKTFIRENELGKVIWFVSYPTTAVINGTRFFAIEKDANDLLSIKYTTTYYEYFKFDYIIKDRPSFDIMIKYTDY